MKLTKLVKTIRKLTLEHFQLYHSQNTTTKKGFYATHFSMQEEVFAQLEGHAVLCFL